MKSLSKSGVDAYQIKNIESPFPRKFDRRINQYKDLTMFFFASFLSLICFVILGGLHMWVKGPIYFYQGIGALLTVILFGVLFKEKNKILSSKNKVKEMIFFFLCFIFGIVGTPVAVASLEMIFLCFNRSLGQGLVLKSVTAIFFIFLVSFLFSYGVKEGKMKVLRSRIKKNGMIKTWNQKYTKKNWVIHEDDLSLKTFLAILISIVFGLFFGLATHYDMFQFLYQLVRMPMVFVLKILAPITIVALVIVQYFFAYKNFQETKYHTDG